MENLPCETDLSFFKIVFLFPPWLVAQSCRTTYAARDSKTSLSLVFGDVTGHGVLHNHYVIE